MTSKLSMNGKKLVNDQVLIRWIYPNDAAKWLSWLMGIPVRTGRFWVEKTVPVYRRKELGLHLLKKFYEKRKEEDLILLPELLKMAGLAYDEVEAVPSTNIARAIADLADAAADRIEAAIDWIEEG